MIVRAAPSVAAAAAGDIVAEGGLAPAAIAHPPLPLLLLPPPPLLPTSRFYDGDGTSDSARTDELLLHRGTALARRLLHGVPVTGSVDIEKLVTVAVNSAHAHRGEVAVVVAALRALQTIATVPLTGPDAARGCDGLLDTSRALGGGSAAAAREGALAIAVTAGGRWPSDAAVQVRTQWMRLTANPHG